MNCQVFSGFAITTVGSSHLAIDTPCVIFRNSTFTATGDWFAILNLTSTARFVEVVNSTFDGGQYHVRGIQADYGSVTVSGSKFQRFGDAAIEMSDRSFTRTLTVTDSYFFEENGWPRNQHVDGIQMNAGLRAVIRNNTILVTPYGATLGDTSYVSNSAIGIGTALGDIGAVEIDHNLMAGGGYLIYVQGKDYVWRDTVSITNNVFDTRYTPRGAIWGALYPGQLPPQLTWSGNTWNQNTPCTLSDALR
jgi:hypothetical protein